MLVVRAIQLSDTDAFTALCGTAGLGLSSLPKTRDALRQKIEQSVRCFATPKAYADDLYIFVLEDTTNHALIGTSQLSAKTLGWTDGYCFLVENSVLNPVLIEKPTTELRGLFLHANHRKGGLSKLISFSRFLFLGAHPEQFQPTIIAEMRGYIEDKMCPFWNGIGRRFLDIEFEEISRRLETNPSLVKNILPKDPIDISLLPKQVQEVIGKTHPNTEIALRELLAEGFQFNGEIDLVDGGPIVEAEISDLRSIKEQVLTTFHMTDPSLSSDPNFIISNTRMDFRACMGMLNATQEGIVLHPDVAQALGLTQGEPIRYIPRYRPKEPAA